MISRNEILETLEMIGKYHLDVRTITMGLSLFDCISDSADKTAQKVYEKIIRCAGKIVETGNRIEKLYGIPVVNKRVSVTPISMIGASSDGFIEIARAMDRASKEIGIDFIGGYSAMVQKGMTKAERDFIITIPEVLATTERVCSSINVASTRAGINMDAVKLMGEIIKETAFLTRENDSVGCAKFVVFSNAVDDNPFMAGAFNGVGEGDKVINVGVSGPGVIREAIRYLPNADLTEIAEIIKKMAFKITRVGQLVALKASEILDANFGIVDLSLAPTPVIGDSVGHILEDIGLESVGACGTTAALALLNSAVKKGGIMASSHIGGLSGAFIPISEDVGMIDAVEKGILSLEKLEAMTAVCSVGIDMVAVPGDTSAEIISALIADECAIGMVNNKTTAVRIIPAYGKKVGDKVNYGGLLGYAPVMKINCASPSKFIARGGRIPAPINGNNN